MTTPTKTTPAKKTAPAAKPAESEASKASRTAPIDLSFLNSVKPTTAPRAAVGSGRGRKAEDNSLVEGWLASSWEERELDKAATKRANNTPKHIGAGYALPNIPVEAVTSLKSKFNRAAAKLEVGVSLSVEHNGKVLDADALKALPKGTKVVLKYHAKSRKTNKK